jgi:hypothetical protein
MAKLKFSRKDPRLDRLIKFDPRSRAYPIRATIDARKPRSYTWSCGVWLDQGQEGACTGFAVCHEAAARPCVVSVSEDVARQVYYRARVLDEWPGENYEGSSVLAAVKAGQERGWYDEYRWAFGLEDLKLALGYKGPAVLGVYWYEGMTNVDAAGFIRPTGQLVGGHAILANGISLKQKCVRLHNSWGKGWGRSGDCFISFDDLGVLLSQDGEACIPVLRKKPK